MASTRIVTCTLCDEPHEMAAADESRARVTRRELEILTHFIDDPLRRAHVARVVRAAGPRPWSELCQIASRAEASKDEWWPVPTIRDLAKLSYKQLVARAAAEARAIARLDAHADHCVKHRRRMSPGHENESGDHGIWAFFIHMESLEEAHPWTLRILRRLNRARSRSRRWRH
jgi:hypothetical protein